MDGWMVKIFYFGVDKWLFFIGLEIGVNDFWEFFIVVWMCKNIYILFVRELYLGYLDLGCFFRVEDKYIFVGWIF